jgi:glutamate dehydrogenase
LAFDRVKERVPSQYVKNAIASSIASKMVYREGTKFVDAQPQDKLATIALAYIEKGKQVALLRESLEKGGVLGDSEKQDILALLEAGGARTALNLF